MNRISRRSADEAAEDLLAAGRTDPVLQYDVELGLERHHQWLRSEAPMPEWASAGVAAKSLVPIAIKTLLSAVLIGTLGVTAWQALGGPQPSAAGIQRSSPLAERTLAVAPSVPDVTVSEAEARMAPKPIPVLHQGLSSDRTVRADVPDKRTTRPQRSARAANARASAAADTTPAREEPAALANTEPSEERATGHEVPSAPEPKSISVANKARPEPGPRAQAPDDLAEMRQVATAEQLLERSPERALALVHEGDRRFARGYFQQERAYIAIMSLIRLGRLDEARARAARFAKQFPALPYGARIRSALEARDAAAR